LDGETTVRVNKPPPDLRNVKAVAAGLSTAWRQIRRNGVAWARTIFNNLTFPRACQALRNFCGAYFSMALRSDGTVVAWGDNTSGEILVPKWFERRGSNAAGEFHALALVKDGTVVAWGENGFKHYRFLPRLTNVVAVAAGATTPGIGPHGFPLALGFAPTVDFSLSLICLQAVLSSSRHRGNWAAGALVEGKRDTGRMS
jgi:hypothetical protein